MSVNGITLRYLLIMFMSVVYKLYGITLRVNGVTKVSGVTSSGKGVTLTNRPCLKPKHMEYIQAILAGKSGKKIKMVSRHNINIAEELNSQLEPQSFTKILCMLDNKSSTTIEQFKRSNLFLSSSQWIDSWKFLTCRGAAIASGIFELFGQFSGKSGNEVGEDLLVWISENKNNVQTCVKVVLDHKGYNLSYWMTKMSRIQTQQMTLLFTVFPECTKDM